MDRRLVRVGGEIFIHYSCNQGCTGQEFIAPLGALGKSYLCPRCRARINTLPVRCFYQCGGRYQQCPGRIKKLGDHELADNTRHAMEEADLSHPAPTDSFHDDMGDVRRSVVTYRCDGCGHEENAHFGVLNHVPSEGLKCERVVCDSCGRMPSASELPTLAHPLRSIGTNPIN